MVLNEMTGRKSRKFSRKGASAIAAVILFATTMAGTSAAIAADGNPSLDVNITESNVTITGTVSGDCATGAGTFDLTVVNNDVADGQTVGHSVTFYLGTDLSVKSTGAILDATPTPLNGSFTLWEGDTQVSLKLATGPGFTQVWLDTLACPVAPPDPSATIGKPNLTMTFEPEATSGYISINGPVEFQNVPEGSTTAVSFTVVGPGSPVASNSPAEGGSYASAFPVTLTTVEQTFTVTAHALLDGNTIASSESSVLTLPAIDDEGENPDGENPDGENPGGTPGETPGGTPGGTPNTGTPNTGSPNTGGTGNPPVKTGTNSDLPQGVSAGGELPLVWGGVTPVSMGLLGVAFIAAVLVGLQLKRRKSQKLESTGDVQ